VEHEWHAPGQARGGSVNDNDGTNPDDSSGNPNGGENPSSGNLPGKVDRDIECSANAIVPTLVRRLSHVEYARTVSDLFPELAIPEQEFAEDLRVHGFENNATSLNPSAVLVEQYAESAARIAELVGDSAASVLPCDGADMACGSQFIESFGARAFRRPLTDEEQQRYEGFFAQQMEAISFRGALELTVQAFLQAPAFLYRLELDGEVDGDAVQLDDYEMASRLSYFLWQSMPDDELFAAAAAGELHTADQVQTQARRMLDAPRAVDAIVDFHRQWLAFDRVFEENKDPELFPDWSEDLRAAMREESDRFVAWNFEEGDGTIASLLTSNVSFVNGVLAEFYGVDASGDDFQQVTLPEERSGLLTRGTFLASRSHSANGSPPLRGVAVLDELLCDRPPPPPPNADTSTPMSDGEPRTNRELFEARTAPAGCQNCHQRINGIGYGFEAFDATGHYRTTDNDQPVDATGELIGTDVDGTFDGATELSERLATSGQVEYCAVRNWFRYAFAREDQPGDWCKLDALYTALQQHDGDVRELLVQITSSYEFTHRPAEQ
jgi:hypothetical protein